MKVIDNVPCGTAPCWFYTQSTRLWTLQVLKWMWFLQVILDNLMLNPVWQLSQDIRQNTEQLAQNMK